MRLYLIVLSFLLGITPLMASEIGIQWPGWQVSTSETSSTLKYPITNMLDGNPNTAWVFNKWGGSEPSENIEYLNHLKTEFKHGINNSIKVNYYEGKTLICDGIGIINGYAKNRKIYLQNNRITKITLKCLGPKINWSKTYSLKETTEQQHLLIPHLLLSQIEIIINEVTVGQDDDLCISELVLYCDKKPIPWQLTPTVLCNYELGCDASPSYELLRGNKVVILYGDSNNINDAFPQPNNPNRILLITYNQLFLYDFKRSKYVWRQSYTGEAKQFGWQNSTHALMQTYDKQKHYHWYTLNTVNFSWQKCKAPPKKSRGFLRDVNMGC